MNMRLLLWGLFSLGSGITGQAEELALEVMPESSGVNVAVEATIDSFVGKLDRYKLYVGIDPDSEQVVSAEMVFDFADLKTGKTDRDEAMLDWQNHTAYPEGRFVLKEAISADGQSMAKGTLTLHGVAREVAFPVRVTRVDDRYILVGEALIDYTDYGLENIRKMLILTVNPEVNISFYFQGELDKEAKSTHELQTITQQKND